MSLTPAPSEFHIRALLPTDLDDVVSIDTAVEGRSRRAYIERRLQAAIADPASHAQFAAVRDSGELVGFMLARRVAGEFGRSTASVRIELLGQRVGQAHQGIGRSLFEAVAGWSRRHDAAELRTLSDWSRSGLLGWLAAMGFELAPELVLEGGVADSPLYQDRDGPLSIDTAEGPGGEVDFGRDEGNDQEHHSRHGAQVQAMTAADLDAIVRIDRENTGRDRRDYLSARLAEAEQQRSIRASLVARCDGTVVGYLMARADLGDFGRAEPVAVIDTLGVDAGYAQRGVGHALMAQLFANLGALRVDRVETAVPLTNSRLLSFLVSCGLHRSRHLAFRRTL